MRAGLRTALRVGVQRPRAWLAGARDQRILVVGLYKTGTTALASLIHPALAPSQYLFEPRWPAMPALAPGRVLAKVLAGTWPEPELLAFRQGFSHCVVLLRDPRDWLISAMLYGAFNAPYLREGAAQARFLELLRRKEAAPDAVTLGEIFALLRQLGGRDWVDPAAIATQRLLRLRALMPAGDHRLAYADLVKGRVEGLSDYLGLRLRGTARVPRAASRVARTRGEGDWRNWFTPVDVAAYRTALAPGLAALDLPDDWSLPERPLLSPAQGSLYVARLFAERPPFDLERDARRAATPLS